MKFSINVCLEEFKKGKKKAIGKANEDNFDEYEDEFASFEDLTFELNDFDFKDGILEVFGETPIGWINLKFNLDLDDGLKIVKYYLEKLGKLKSVMESVNT